MRTLELPAHTWRIATVGAGVRASRIRVEDASLADAGRTHEIIFAADQSAEAGKPVKIR